MYFLNKLRSTIRLCRVLAINVERGEELWKRPLFVATRREATRHTSTRAHSHSRAHAVEAKVYMVMEEPSGKR